ncbi:MAG: L-rhamnose mutarotase [Lentimonas sp.]
MNKLHRVAFILKLQSGDHIDEYEKRHTPIWPELTEVFVQQGVRNYSIFLDESSLQLFGYAEVESLSQWEAIAETGVCRKWWDYMGEMMETNPDSSPKAVPLREVFHHEC